MFWSKGRRHGVTPTPQTGNQFGVLGLPPLPPSPPPSSPLRGVLFFSFSFFVIFQKKKNWEGLCLGERGGYYHPKPKPIGGILRARGMHKWAMRVAANSRNHWHGRAVSALGGGSTVGFSVVSSVGARCCGGVRLRRTTGASNSEHWQRTRTRGDSQVANGLRGPMALHLAQLQAQIAASMCSRLGGTDSLRPCCTGSCGVALARHGPTALRNDQAVRDQQCRIRLNATRHQKP